MVLRPNVQDDLGNVQDGHGHSFNNHHTHRPAPHAWAMYFPYAYVIYAICYGCCGKCSLAGILLSGILTAPLRCIDGMVEAFKDELPEHVNTPFPEHDKGFITKNEKVSDDDVKLYLNKGYMRMCGLILWAARNCFPECSLGASFLCRVMSCPSKKAYMAGLHMIRWLGQNRLRVIKFTHDPHGYPVAFSDASNKPDPTDSCKQYGYCIMWQGGPVAYVSKKLSHIGHSSAHNEYMALAEAAW